MRRYAPFWFFLGVLALSGLACNPSGLGALLATPAGAAGTPTPVVIVLTPTPLPPELALQSDVEERFVISVYARVAPTVICIKARDHLGGCIGSGFVFDREGHIVTNNHVFDQS